MIYLSLVLGFSLSPEADITLVVINGACMRALHNQHSKQATWTFSFSYELTFSFRR